MSFLSHIRGGSFAGADRPDRFVSDGDVRHVSSSDVCQTAANLLIQNAVRDAAFPFFQGFADADDGLQSVLESSFDTGVDRGIRFPEVLTAFAVTDDHIFHTDFLQHRAGDFTGECAVVCPVNVLSADLDVGALQDFHSRCEAGEGGANCHFHFACQRGEAFFQGFAESFRFCGSLVHFPVTGNKDLACHSSFPLCC